jgi:hypothetical protein
MLHALGECAEDSAHYSTGRFEVEV